MTEALDLCDGPKTCSEILGSTDAGDSAVLLYTLDYLKCLSYSETPVKTSVPPPFPLRERMRDACGRESRKSSRISGEN